MTKIKLDLPAAEPPPIPPSECDGHNGCDCTGNYILYETDADRVEVVQPIVEYWTQQLGLDRLWEVSYHFVDDIDDHKTFADITSFSPYNRAVMRISRWAMDHDTMDALEMTIVHELQHLILDPIETLIRTYFGGTTGGAFVDDMTNTIEEICDRLVYIVRHLDSHEEAFTTVHFAPFDEKVRKIGS